MSDTENISQIIQKGNLKRIVRYFEKRKTLIEDFRDQKNNTLLHLATLNGNLNLIRGLQEQVKLIQISFKYKESSKSILERWCNESNQDGFIPLHYSAYRGYFKIFVLLEEMGSNLRSVNKDGLGLIHTAAQGDQPLIISYLQSKGLAISIQDKKGGTPLHWSSYMGCEISSSLLLSYQVDTNLQDQDGQTPLHLASLAGNSRIIRGLLIKGASIKIRDHQGRTAFDLAKENNKTKVLHLLKPIHFCDEFKMKAPLRPSNRSCWGFLTFALMYLIKIALSTVWCLEYYEAKILASYFSIEVLWLISCFVAISKDPGYIKKSSQNKLFDLYQSFESHLICPDCVVVRQPRSRHCQFCNKCVEKFDHHCPWINNCIGGKNLGWFLLFVFITLVSLLTSLALVAGTFAVQDLEQEIIEVHFVLRGLIVGVNLALLVLFSGLVMALAGFQLQNFFRGVTTCERLTEGGESLQKSYSCGNFKNMCFNWNTETQGKASLVVEDLTVELQSRG